MIIEVEKLYVNGNFNKMYKVKRSSNQWDFVPEDTANTDYQAIQTWIADGGTVIDNGGGE